MVGAWMCERCFRSRAMRATICGLIAALGIGLVVVSNSWGGFVVQDQQDSPSKSSKSAQEKRTARKARELKAATKKKALQDLPSVPAADLTKYSLPKRPGRLVTPPTMTSGELDRLVSEYLTRNSPKIEPAPLTSDVEFVRRIYFDVIGKPPTSEQVQIFLRDRAKDKRSKLIDTLLDSPEHAQLGQVLARRDQVPFNCRERGSRSI